MLDSILNFLQAHPAEIASIAAFITGFISGKVRAFVAYTPNKIDDFILKVFFPDVHQEVKDENAK